MRKLRIAVCLDLREPLSRQVLGALGAAALARPEWSLAIEGYGTDGLAELLRCDLLVVRRWDHAVLRQASVRRRAVVLSGEPVNAAHRVWSDDRAVGMRAARHLIERGCTRLAFREDRRFRSFRERQAGFQRAAKQAGVEILPFPSSQKAGRKWNHAAESRESRRQLQAFPDGTGIAAYDAPTARRLAADALAAGRRIPDNLALIACSDDPLLCALGHPHLTAVHLPLDQLATAVVAGVESLAAGRRPGRPVLIPPDLVVERGSTGQPEPGGSGVGAAIGLMESRGLGVAEAAAALGMGRRTLERRFRGELGHGPGRAVARARMDRALACLRDGDDSIAAIATACGYASHASFCHVFRRVHGQSPTAWRAAGRGR
jgi:AraC-like DNA-binding protein